MSKKAEKSYFERLENEVMAAYGRVGNYSSEEMDSLERFAQLLLGTPLPDNASK